MKDIIVYSGTSEFDKDVLQSQIPVAVYFYSEDCPHCAAVTPIIRRMSESMGAEIRFVSIFRQQNRVLADKLGVKSSPTILFFNKGKEVCSRLSGYISRSEIKSAIETILGGQCVRKERQRVRCDVLIMGAGPAGLSAAIYAARAKLQTVLVDEGIPGGQAATTFHVANYPGTNGVVRGTDLMENMKSQALSFGVQLDDMKEVNEVVLDGNEKYVKTEDTDYYAKAVIIATGASPRRLPADGEKEFRGRGVHYCATCDGAMYQDAEVIVVGGGNSAVEEAVFLTRYATHVTILHQLDHFQASRAAQDEALKNPNISVVWDTEIRKINGENFVTGVTVENLKTGQVSDLKTDGIFVYIGMEPKSGLFKGKVNINEQGYLIVDEDMSTSIPGVFSAGDVREKKIRQIATAVGDGVVAGMMAERFVIGKGGI